MAFNHYAKLKRILDNESPGWYIRKIKEPTSAKSFRGDTVSYPHYYRLYSHNNLPIRYGKFQQIERLAQALSIPAEELPVVED